MNGTPSLTAQAETWLVDLGLGAPLATIAARIVIGILIVLLALLANFGARKLLATTAKTIVRSTRSRSDGPTFDQHSWSTS